MALIIVTLWTSNMTGRHRVWSNKPGLVTERHHYNAHTACCSYVAAVVFFIVKCGIVRCLCARVCYANIPHSDIILVRHMPHHWASPRRKSLTHSLSHPSLFDRPGTKAYCFRTTITNNLDFLYLLVKTSNVSVCFLWSLLQFHDSNHWVSVVRQNTNNSMDLSTQPHQ